MLLFAKWGGSSLSSHCLTLLVVGGTGVAILTRMFVSTAGSFVIPGCFDLLLLPGSTNHVFAPLKGVSIPIHTEVLWVGCLESSQLLSFPLLFFCLDSSLQASNTGEAGLDLVSEKAFHSAFGSRSTSVTHFWVPMRYIIP